MGCLYVVSALIVARSLVRIVEFTEGFQGYLISHEAFLYIFDAALMFSVMVAVGVIHPGEILVALRANRKIEEMIVVPRRVV